MSALNINFTDVQVKGFYHLFKGLSKQVIFDLTDSVTKKSITVTSEKEAFKAIISFSTSAEELLQRRKITRNLLMQYAFEEKISIPGSAEKKEIISKILNHWNKVPQKVQNCQISSCTQPKKLVETEHPVLQQNTVTSNQPVITQIGNVEAFGQAFVSWFYSMWNSHNQKMNTSKPLDFGPHHFWPDATLQVNTLSEPTVMGSVGTAERLLQFVQQGLYFHANINEGVFTKSESHGLICIIVHGTVHKEQYCVGPFEQAFTLLQDPWNDNNWKIKSICLNVNNAEQANKSCSLLP